MANITHVQQHVKQHTKTEKTTIEVMSIVIIYPAGSNPNRKKRQQKVFEDIKGECIEL